MSAIAELRNSSKLFALLSKFLNKYYDKDQLIELLNRELTDAEYFKIFSDKIGNITYDLNKINYDRGRKRLKEITTLLKKNKLTVQTGSRVVKNPFTNNITNFSLFSNSPAADDLQLKYIDIGCDDGIITYVIGQGLGFKTEEIICCDVKSEIKNDLTYIKTNGHEINLPSKSISFVTLFQTIHHMTEPDKMLAEIARICVPNALLIIREHDAGFERFRESNVKLFKLEHQLYDIVMDKISETDFEKNYYATYYSCNELKHLMARHGFVCIHTEYVSRYNPTNYYYAVYKFNQNA